MISPPAAFICIFPKSKLIVIISIHTSNLFRSICVIPLSSMMSAASPNLVPIRNVINKMCKLCSQTLMKIWNETDLTDTVRPSVSGLFPTPLLDIELFSSLVLVYQSSGFSIIVFQFLLMPASALVTGLSQECRLNAVSSSKDTCLQESLNQQL